MNGYGDGTFGPGDPATVFESIKILLNPSFKQEIEAQEGFSEATDWFQPYVDFALAKNFDDSFSNGASKKSTRLNVAELIFKSLLTSEQNWEVYQDHLADRLLAEEGKSHLFSSDAPCYDFRDVPLPEFMMDYIKQEYGLDTVIEDWDIWEEGNQTLPFFDANGFCYLENGGSMLFGGSVDEQEVLRNHKVEFDASDAVVEDETLMCGSSEEGFLTHPFTLTMHITDPNSLEILDCRYAKDKNSLVSHKI